MGLQRGRAWHRPELARMLSVVLFVFGLFASGCERPSLDVDDWRLELDVPALERAVEIPARLDDVIPAEDLTYRLRATVHLPSHWHGRELSLTIARFEAVVSLDVDGRTAVSERIDLYASHRRASPHVWRIPAAATHDGRLELQLQVLHRWTQSSWLLATPILHAADEPPLVLVVSTFFNDFIQVAGFFGLALMAMVYLWVFLFDRVRSRYYLWFAIQAGTASFYPLYACGLSQVLFGHWEVFVLVAALSVALVVSVRFTHAHFELGTASQAWSIALLGVLAVAAVFGTPGPYTATNYLAPPVVVLLGSVVVYTLVVVARLLGRKPRPRGALIFLAAWSILGLSAASDGIAWLGWAEPLHGVRAAGFGLMMFAILQSLLVGRELIASLRLLNLKLGDRVEALQERQREIQQLNEELRRQIADRSRQMFTALNLISDKRVVVPELAPGDLVQGRYRVVGKAGKGGMGTVYVVVREGDGERFALKVATRLDTNGLARFAREAEIAARVRHPNLVEIVDVDVAEAGYFFLVMELVDGPSLADLRDRFGDVPWALAILGQVAHGLAALHEVNIVHRDVKPTNVLLVGSGGARPQAKLADYGVSTSGSTLHDEEEPHVIVPARPTDGDRVSSEDGDTVRVEMSPSPEAWLRPPGQGELTRADEFIGTPTYMAPELGLSAQLVQPKCDMFSFGVLAHQILTGSLPFEQAPVLRLLQGEPVPRPVPLRDRCSTIDPVLAALLDRCLAVAPDERPDAHRMATRLAEHLGNESRTPASSASWSRAEHV